MTDLSTRLDAFDGIVRGILEGHDGPDALKLISRAHAADVEALDSRATAAADETSHALYNARMRTDMLTVVHQSATAELLRNAKMHAHLQLVMRIIDRTRALVTQAEGDGKAVVTVDDLRAILAEPLSPVDLRPTMSGVVYSAQFQYGRFEGDGGALHVSYPFAGWCMVAGPTTPGRPWEPCFYVDDVLYSKSGLLADMGLTMKALL